MANPMLMECRDEIAALRARVAELETEARMLRHDADAEWGASATERETLRARAEKAEAERDALRAQSNTRATRGRV